VGPRARRKALYVIVGAGVLAGFITLVARQAMDHQRPKLTRSESKR